MRFGGHVAYLYHFFTPSGNKGREYQLFLPFNCILKSTEESPVNTYASKIAEYAGDSNKINHISGEEVHIFIHT